MTGVFLDRPSEMGADVLHSIQNTTQTQPTNKTAITGTTEKMMGYAVAFTPRRSGKLEIQIDGNITVDTTAQTTTARLKYGTGAAPENDAAVTGTQAGKTKTFVGLTGMLTVPFAMTAFVNAQANVGVAMWFDFDAKTSDAGAAGGVLDLNFVIKELS